jgi:hypothetical protein
MSPDPTAQIVALGIEPTYSAREAAAMLGRSYSWLDQCLRDNKFTLPDGTRLSRGERQVATGASPWRFWRTLLSCYRHGLFPTEKLRFTYRELLLAAHRETGEYKIPG